MIQVMMALWPFLIMFAIVGGLTLAVRAGKTRSPLPVATTVELASGESAEVVVLAELVRSGAFYVCGAVLDWKRCVEFASGVVSDAGSVAVLPVMEPPPDVGPAEIGNGG